MNWNISLKAAIIIPARLASSRLPQKLLLADTGQTLIEHTYRAAEKCSLAEKIIVAADSDEIVAAVTAFGGNVVMTSPDHQSGSDRVAEVAAQIDSEIVINLQGDEPELGASAIDLLIERLSRDESLDVATLACPIRNSTALGDPSCVKVVIDNFGRAMFFSRSPIPAVRDPKTIETWFEASSTSKPLFLQHIGIYGFRKSRLLELSSLQPSPYENIESLEQLRFLSNGWKIGVEIVKLRAQGIDTLEDYAAFVKRWQNR